MLVLNILSLLDFWMSHRTGQEGDTTAVVSLKTLQLATQQNFV